VIGGSFLIVSNKVILSESVAFLLGIPVGI
jgi:hypothetical protein